MTFSALVFSQVGFVPGSEIFFLHSLMGTELIVLGSHLYMTEEDKTRIKTISPLL
jgi:hypothetical protein